MESLLVSAESDKISQPGGTLQLSATALPEKIPYQSVIWSVTEPDGTKTDKAVVWADDILKAYM